MQSLPCVHLPWPEETPDRLDTAGIGSVVVIRVQESHLILLVPATGRVQEELPPAGLIKKQRVASNTAYFKRLFDHCTSWLLLVLLRRARQ